jgi:hypothetical protein
MDELHNMERVARVYTYSSSVTSFITCRGLCVFARDLPL